MGETRLQQNSAYHINGNALYQVGDPRFMAFALNVWRRNLFDMVDEQFTLAYDCWIGLRRWLRASRKTGLDWHWSVAFNSTFIAVPFVINLLKLKAIWTDLKSAGQIERLSGYRHIFFHAGCAPQRFADFPGTEKMDVRAFLVTNG